MRASTGCVNGHHSRQSRALTMWTVPRITTIRTTRRFARSSESSVG